MSIYVSYILLGLSLAAPIGPINAAQLDKGIKNGFFHAWLVGLGATVADAVYMMVVYLGVVHFLEIPFMKTFLWLFGCFVLIYTGIESLIKAKVILNKEIRSDESSLKAFVSGFLLSLANPITILFWLGIYGSVLAKTANTYGTQKLLLLSGAIFLGLMIWDITMATIASGVRKYATTNLLTTLSIFSSLFLIGFGVYFGFQGIRMLLS